MKLLLFVLFTAALLLGPAMLDVANAAPANAATPTWILPSVTRMGESTGYDPGSDWATLMYTCGRTWNGRDDENTYTVVKFSGPTRIFGVRFGSLAWNGTGVLGANGQLWLRDAAKLTAAGSDGRPLWHNNFRGDNDGDHPGWSPDGIRANQLAPAFPNGEAGLTFQIPFNVMTHFSFTWAQPVTVTQLRAEFMDFGGGGSFTVVRALELLTDSPIAGRPDPNWTC